MISSHKLHPYYHFDNQPIEARYSRALWWYRDNYPEAFNVAANYHSLDAMLFDFVSELTEEFSLDVWPINQIELDILRSYATDDHNLNYSDVTQFLKSICWNHYKLKTGKAKQPFLKRYAASDQLRTQILIIVKGLSKTHGIPLSELNSKKRDSAGHIVFNEATKIVNEWDYFKLIAPFHLRQALKDYLEWL